MSQRKKQAVVSLLFLLEITAVLIFAKLMAPIREGNSAGFWRNACGVDLRGKGKGPLGGIYQPRDGWYIYYVQGYHGQSLFRVRRSVAVADYSEIIQSIQQSPNKEDAAPVLRRAYAVIERNRSQVEQDPEKLLSLIGDQRMTELKQKDEHLYQYAISEGKAFAERWVRVQRFWMNVVFESILFVGLSLFVFWPWLRDKGWRNTTLHLGLLPLLLFVPYYLGYAGWTFTSAGPSGGVLYPWIIVWFRGFPIWTPIDQWLLETLPKALEPLSQPLGPMISISGGRPLGPVGAAMIGGAILAVAWGTFGFLRHRNPAAEGSTDNASECTETGTSRPDAPADADKPRR